MDALELLSTTRAVRKRLDFDRPVEREVLERCLELALQAPSGSNVQGWHFVVVTDEAKRMALADIYRKAYGLYRQTPMYIGAIPSEDPSRQAQQQRSASSADFLADNLHRAPALVIPCISGRTDGVPAFHQAAVFGSILPAAWSFMLACRAHGLGTSWTTLHLMHEQEAAEVIGLPYDEVMQTALTPVAYTVGTTFKPATRQSLSSVVHWDAW
jgi:nitroreductase